MKNIKIPQDEIDKLMKTLDITEEEAIETWKFDHDYVDNEEVDIMTKKAKENKTDKIVVVDKTNRKKVERTPKDNPTKEFIVSQLYQALQPFAESIDITNKTKLIEFSYQGKNFKLDLVEKRQKKS
jgi:hypothetical protein